MFTREQRFLILKYGSITLLTLSALPIMMHGIFFIVLFQYYLPAAIILFALYFSYTKVQEADLSDQDIKQFHKYLFTHKEK
jgi:uncharacterized membrane protein YobD (UPF0266 family)